MPISPYLKNLRQYVGHDLILTPGADAIVHNERGEVLLQRRSDNGQWGLLGGVTDPNESPAQAVVREVYEESGLIVRPKRCVALIKLDIIYPNEDHLQGSATRKTSRVPTKIVETYGGRDGKESSSMAKWHIALRLLFQQSL